jgi:hypothetical protein
MKTYTSFWLLVTIPIFGAAMIAATCPAAAASLNVTNDGADSVTCGSQTNPCRSISQAIENASDGDTIEVGAGHYGNVSGDPNFAGPGDEHPQHFDGVVYSGCIVCITKALRIFSVHGAAVTVIEGIPSVQFSSNVMIRHDGVIFGREGGGFTLTGGNQNGLVLDQDLHGSTFGILLQHNVVVAGNVDLGDQNGFVFHGLGLVDVQCPDPSCAATAQIIFSSNQAINNSGGGFSVTVNLFHGGPITLQDNLASGGGSGFDVEAGFQNEGLEAVFAGNVQVVGNVAIHNSIGFTADVPGRIVGNTAAGNSQFGFLVVPGGASFQDNSAIGNDGPGAIIQFSQDATNNAPIPRFQTFTQNNFYGNDRNRPVLSIAPALSSNANYNPGPSAHCGVLNLGALAVAVGPNAGGIPPIINLAAAGNFWGSAQGPQVSGSGDAVGGVCDQNGGVTQAKPFAIIPFGITSWP